MIPRHPKICTQSQKSVQPFRPVLPNEASYKELMKTNAVSPGAATLGKLLLGCYVHGFESEVTNVSITSFVRGGLAL
jgi:hypothetical protein